MTLPLDTAPGPSPDAEAIRNAGISRELLLNARLELDKGDLLQASDKAWGAAAFAIKAVAEKRRWFNEADWKLSGLPLSSPTNWPTPTSCVAIPWRDSLTLTFTATSMSHDKLSRPSPRRPKWWLCST